MPDEVSLDLAPRELIAPRVRRVALLAVVAGIVAGVVVSLLANWLAGVVVALVVGAPTALASIGVLRRRLVLSGSVVHAHRAITHRTIDVRRAVTAELVVRTGRVSIVTLRIGDGSHTVNVPLAVYAGAAGRELHILGLRRLADALDGSELVAAVALSTVLVQQLRAEARDAAAGERPLYRAVQRMLDAGRGPTTTLTDSEVAALLDG